MTFDEWIDGIRHILTVHNLSMDESWINAAKEGWLAGYGQHPTWPTWQQITTAPTILGQRILVWDEDNQIAAAAQWNDYRKRWDTDDNESPKILYWMPLPLSPHQ